MVEIIAFPGKSSSSVVDTSKLNLPGSPVTPVPAAMSAVDGPLIRSVHNAPEGLPDGDWTNQELADLYRVESLLVQAGIKMSTGRGVTDENDPWFVFCREDGDVFVHLARADGRYLLDSPGLSGLLEGPDFATLIDRFVEQLAALRQPEKTGNVVSFRPKMLKDKSVLLHPSVLLAALVWSLYLSSDDIASATEAATDLAEDPFLPIDQLLQFGEAPGLQMREDDPFTALELQNNQIDAGLRAPFGLRIGPAPAGGQETDRAASGPDRLVTTAGSTLTASSPAAQAVAASLAIIAFSYGFYGPKGNKDTDSSAETGPALAGLQAALRQVAENGLSRSKLQSGETAVITRSDLDAEPIVLASLDGTIGAQADLLVNMSISLEANSQNVIAEKSLPIDLAVPETGVPGPEAGEAEPVLDAEDQIDDTSAAKQASQAPQKTGPAEQAAPVQQTVETKTGLSQVLDSVGTGTSYKLGATTVSTTADQDEFQKFVGFLQDWGSDASAGSDGKDATISIADLHPALKNPLDRTPGDGVPQLLPSEPISGPGNLPVKPKISAVNAEIADFTAMADFFVSKVFGNIKTVETVFFNTGLMVELVLFDKTAIDDSNDRPYALSWVKDDGMVVSVVGHYQNFADFGLA